MNQNAFLLARQPIYDRELKVVGYELLFRSLMGLTAADVGGNVASSQVLLNAFTNLTVEDVVGKNMAFVNFTRDLLMQTPPFPANQLVIELLEDISPDNELIQQLMVLRKEGYQVALDDFVHNDVNSVLLDHSDIVKLEVHDKTPEQIKHVITSLRTKNVRILAEKVETHEMMQLCKNLGFDYFQGYFLSKPQLVHGRALNESQLAVLSLLARLNNPDTTPAEIETILASDPVLTYKLIRLANSPLMRASGHTETLRRAIQVMGLNKIRSWVTLLVFTQLSSKPRSLMVNTLVRAYMCQQLGAHLSKPIQSDRFFTVALLSMLDVFLDQPMVELIAKLDMPSDMSAAIVEHAGPLGQALEISIHFERAEWELIPWLQLERASLDASTATQYYLNALRHAAQAEGLLN